MRSKLIVLTLSVMWQISSPFADTFQNFKHNQIDSILLTMHDYHRKDDDSCLTLGKNARTKIMHFYYSGQIDSIKPILKYWTKSCQANNTDSRIVSLIAMYDSNFTEALIDSSIFKYADCLQRSPDSWTDCNFRYTYDLKKLYDDFNKCIIDFAKNMTMKYDTNSVEYLYALYLSTSYDKFYKRLNDTIFNSITLKKLYTKEIHRTRMIPSPRIGYFIEGWFPTNTLSPIKSHCSYSLFLGVRWLWVSIEANVALRLGTFRDKIISLKNVNADTILSFGMSHASLDFLSPPLKFYNQEIVLSIGAGVDKIADSLKLISKAIYPGLEYRYFLGKNRETFAGIHLNYYPFSFNTYGGTNLHRKGYSIRLLYSLSDRIFTEPKLKALRYKKIF